MYGVFVFFFSSRRRHTRYWRDWSSDVCSSDLALDDPVADPLPRVDAPYAYAVLLDAGDAEVRGLRAQGQNEVLVGELSSGCRHDPSLRVHGIEVGPPEAGAESDQGPPQRLRYVVRLHVAAYDAGQHRPEGEVVLPVDDHHPDVVAVPG